MLDYLLAIAVFGGLYALMALGLNVIWGLAGMINLGLAGFYAVGAYVSALLTVRLGLPMPLAWMAAALASAALGAIVAVITARLRGDYLAIVSLGFAEVIRLIASNEIGLTHGTEGISGVPGPFRGAVSPQGYNIICNLVVWCIVALVGLALARLSGAPFGRVLRAIREDETVAAVAGKRTLGFKVQAFAIGAFVLGLAGGLYASFNAYVAPDAFTPLITLTIVLALTAGGTGNMAGAVLGAVLVVALTEGTRFIGVLLPALQPVQVAALRQGAIGVALILALHLRPQGLLPERRRRYPAPETP